MSAKIDNQVLALPEPNGAYMSMDSDFVSNQISTMYREKDNFFDIFNQPKQ